MAKFPDKRSITARGAFSKDWVRHYGWPVLVVTDQGPEFTGKEFTEYLGEAGCLQRFIDSQSPWQQGRTERAGGSIAYMLKEVIAECGSVAQPELETALTSALGARNCYCNRSGYSAH